MNETAMAVASEARHLSKQNERDIMRHEEICAERYAGINASVISLGDAIKDVNRTLFKGVVTILGAMSVVIMALIGAYVSENHERVDNAITQTRVR